MSETKMKRGLYVHIPFCAKKCHYCNFVITVQQDASMRKRFLDSLEREMEQARSFYGPLELNTLYFGGGTPSLLAPEEIKFLTHLENLGDRPVFTHMKNLLYFLRERSRRARGFAFSQLNLNHI